MRAPTPVVVAVGLGIGLSLGGCSPAPAPNPTASAPPPSPAPSATSTAVALPPLETVLTLLDSAAGDDRAPSARLGAVLEPDQPFTLADEREAPLGPGIVRVACSSAGADTVTITVEIGGISSGSFAAPCGDAPASIFTTQDAAFDFSGPYVFTVSAARPTVVGLGVVPDAAE